MFFPTHRWDPVAQAFISLASANAEFPVHTAGDFDFFIQCQYNGQCSSLELFSLFPVFSIVLFEIALILQ